MLEGVFDEHFKYKAKYPVKVALPVIPTNLDLYWSAFFGELDPDLVPIVEAHYTKPVDVERVDDIPGDLGRLLSPDVLFPRRLVQHGLRRQRHGFAARGDASVFFMDASNVDDIVDFWNFRAMGRPLIGLPKQLADNESLRGVLIKFLRSNRRHWRNNPKVCDVASFIRSRHSTMDEMQEFAKSLDLMPPEGDSSKDGYYVLQRWYPRIWDSWARDKDAATPDDFYTGDDGTVELGQTPDRSVRLTAVVPDFAESRGIYSHAKCANEINFSIFGSSEHLAEAFPASYGPAVRRAIGGVALRDEWRIGRNGLVKLVAGVGSMHVKIPAAQEILFAWLADQGWKPELSTAGILAKQIYRQCDGQVGFLANPKVLNILEHMNGGNVTPDGKPTERDKLSEERSLAVQHVKCA
ncbi:MAG: hypothetical protein ABS36_06115 [Acidobacteria bacterium SCN 69-37]|nr:MAG: hypothetical protein ABS36_06115 [Acidobacteria bacterium SCN 69-37]